MEEASGKQRGHVWRSQRHPEKGQWRTLWLGGLHNAIETFVRRESMTASVLMRPDDGHLTASRFFPPDFRLHPTCQQVAAAMSRPLSVSTVAPTLTLHLLTLRVLQQRIYAGVFSKWPKQELRPDYQFQDAVQEAVKNRMKSYKPSMEPEEVLKARALQFLVQDKFMTRVRLPSDVVSLEEVLLTENSTDSVIECSSRRASRRISTIWYERSRRHRNARGSRD